MMSEGAILVSTRQRGNPLLRYVKNVRWQFAENLVPDYQLGPTTVALFLSLKYHLLHPNYIHYRIRELQRSFRLRVLLVHVDLDDPVKPLATVTKLACFSDFTLICGWSYEECARYLETFKTYETKPHDLLLGNKTNAATEDYTTRVTHALTQIRGVNRTDVLTLTTAFGTLKDILQASEEDLSTCAGLGPTKVKRLYDAFNTGFYPSLHRPRQPAPATAHDQGGGTGVGSAPPRQGDPSARDANGSGEAGSRQEPGQNKKSQEIDDFDIDFFLDN